MASLDETLHNPLNGSTSKQQYSFNRSQRFRQNLHTEQTDVFYQVHNRQPKITYSFGKSNRYKAVPTAISNSPFYDIDGDFERLIKKRDGIKIMYGRQDCKANSIFKTSNNPGPGAYDPNPEFTESRIALNCSLGKLPNHNRLVKQQQLPGPANYNIHSSLLNEHKILSKDSKKSYGKILFPTSKSNLKIKTQADPEIRFPQITYKGDRPFRSNGGHSIAKALRFKPYINDTPGPGSYKKFSEFIEASKK